MASKRKYKTEKVGLLGGPGVGKGAINARFCADFFLESYDPAGNGEYYRKQVTVDGELCIVETLDAEANENFSPYYQAMQEIVIKECDAILLIYSITSQPSFDSILERYEHIINVRRQHSLARLPVYLIANKCDELRQQVVTLAEGLALAEHLGCRFAQVSAKNALNIESVFCDTVRDIRKTREEAKAKELLVERNVPPNRRKSRLGSIVQLLRA